MVKYAQIDDTGKVVGISYLSGKVGNPLMIEVGEDFNSFDKRYVDGKWEDIEPVEPTEPEESVDTEEVLAEILMNQTAIKQKQEEQDETLAMLMLNNEKGE